MGLPFVILDLLILVALKGLIDYFFDLKWNIYLISLLCNLPFLALFITLFDFPEIDKVLVGLFAVSVLLAILGGRVFFKKGFKKTVIERLIKKVCNNQLTNNSIT